MKENKVVFIFGGSGYIGSFFIKKVLKDRLFDKIVIFDLKEPGYLTPDEKNSSLISFHLLDVRQPIDFRINFDFNQEESWILNLAAIHREPGHDYKEYFDTNIPGAEHINEFADRTNIPNLLFTSSIAPYGKSLEQRDEESPLYPETAYGISKALAEQIHQRWLAEKERRRLVIVRPSVIFGPRDPGNVYRMIRSLKKGTFVLPDGGHIVKGYGYIYGLVESMLFTMSRTESLTVYNYAENPVVSLREMVVIAKEELKIKRPTISMPVSFLVLAAFIFQFSCRLTGKKTDIHPVRVRKAGFPTNIKPSFLIKKGFDFKYDFRNALKHWVSVSPEDFIE